MPGQPYSSQYWSATEVISPSQARLLQADRLRDQLAYLAEHSDFYRAKFADHGVDATAIRDLDDLTGLPFTEKSELRASALPTARRSARTSRPR